MAEKGPENAGDKWFDFPEISWAAFWDEFLNSILTSKLGPWLVEVASPVISKGVTLIVATFIEIVAAAGKTVGESIDEYEATAAPTLTDAAARALSDYFDTHVDASELRGGGGYVARQEVANRIGRQVLSTMMGRLTDGEVLTPESGKAAAEKMVGFALSTSMESWLAGVISHPILQRFIPNWADLDELLDSSLGFRRIVRQATGPVAETVIGRPFRWWLNETYRPERLELHDVVRSWIHGDVTDDELHRRMGELGWTREDTARQISLVGRYPFKEDIARMLRMDMVTEERATELFRRRGFLPDMSELLMAMYRDLGIDAANQRIKTLARSLYADRLISEEEFRRALASAHVREEEIDKWAAVGELERTQVRRITEGDMERAHRESFITDDDLEDFYRGRGYPEQDVAILMRLELQRKAEYEGVTDKEKTITQGKAEQAFRKGVIRRDDLVRAYEDLGYKSDAIAILVKLQETIKREAESKGAGQQPRR